MANIVINLAEKKTKHGTTYADLEFKKQKPLGKSVDLLAIRGALHNIFSWKPGERILDPAFGNGLYRTLFEPMSSELHGRQLAMVRRMLSYEPRIHVETLDVIPDPMRQTVNIVISYSIPKLGISEVYEQTVSARPQ